MPKAFCVQDGVWVLGDKDQAAAALTMPQGIFAHRVNIARQFVDDVGAAGRAASVYNTKDLNLERRPHQEVLNQSLMSAGGPYWRDIG